MSDGNAIARAGRVRRSVCPPDRHHVIPGAGHSFYIQRGINMRAQLPKNCPVRFHLAKRPGQHLLAHASDQFTKAGETQGAVIAKHLDGKHRPLIGHPSDDLANQRVQSGSCCCGGAACIRWLREGGSGFTVAFHSDTLLRVSMALLGAYFPMVRAHHTIEVRRRSCKSPAIQF